MADWSPFAGVVTSTLEIPHSGGKEITIRKLGFRQLQKAADAVTARAGALLQAIGGAAAFAGAEAMLTAAGADKGGTVTADPFLQYDPLQLIILGVAKWPDNLKPTAESLEGLDGEFADWLARAIYELSRPRTPEERKND